MNDEAGQGLVEEAIKRVDEVLALFGAILRIAEVESGETRRYFAPVDIERPRPRLVGKLRAVSSATADVH